MKLRKNSTHNLHKTFNELATLSRYSNKLRIKFELIFSEKTISSYTLKSPLQDMQALAIKLFKARYTQPRLRGDAQFKSPNILGIGVEAFGEKIKDFNTCEVRINNIRRDIPFTEGDGEILDGYPLSNAAAYVRDTEGDDYIDVKVLLIMLDTIDLSSA